MAQKKIKDRTAKNIETFLQKNQINKYKATLFNNFVAKKSSKKIEDIAKIESKFESKAKIKFKNSNIVCKFEFI